MFEIGDERLEIGLNYLALGGTRSMTVCFICNFQDSFLVGFRTCKKGEPLRSLCVLRVSQRIVL